MKCFVALLFLSTLVTSWATSSDSSRSGSRSAKYIASNIDDYDYGYGYGVAAAVHFQPMYTTSKPVYTNTWKPVVGYKPYKGPGSSYAYGYKPSYSTQKPVYVYKPYYGSYYPYYPYYPYGSVYGYNNPYYYGSYKHGLGYGQIYDYDYART